MPTLTVKTSWKEEWEGEGGREREGEGGRGREGVREKRKGQRGRR